MAYKIITERFSSEKNDCTVRAFSNAFDISYAIAHAELKKFRRRNGHGAQFQSFIKSLNYTYDNKKIEFFERPSMTVGTFLNKHIKGAYIIRVNGHVFAVKDGVALDDCAPRLRGPITGFWKISGGTMRGLVPPIKKLTQKEIVRAYLGFGTTIDEIVALTRIKKTNVA